VKFVTVSECDFGSERCRKAVVSLLNAYIQDDMGGGKVLSPARQGRLVRALREHPKAIVLLAETQNVYCGMLIAFENFSTFTVQAMINIHDLIVMEEYRNCGVGQALLKKITEIARRRKCSRITLEVRCDNRIAQSLYQKFDFQATDPPMFYWRKAL